VKWDFFSSERKGANRKPRDELDKLIMAIERFAPKGHKKERKVYYYNYRIMGQYSKPLMALLVTLSKRKRLDEEPDVLIPELFFRVKQFYDIKDKLSLAEALEDRELLRRFQNLLGYFYGRQTWSVADLKQKISRDAHCEKIQSPNASVTGVNGC
jgi:hypothetical protein